MIWHSIRYIPPNTLSMRMRLCHLLLPIPLLFAACGKHDSSESGTGPLAGQRLVVAVENAHVPFSFIRTDTREAVGWDYDVVAEFARRLGFRPEFRTIAWDSMIQGVATGQFDLAVNGITITPERAQVVDFSQPYMVVTQRLLVRIDENRFDSMPTAAALPEVRIGAQKGNANYAPSEKLVGAARVRAYDGFGELIQALISGDVDAVLIDDVGGQGYVGANREKLRMLADGIPGSQLGLVFPKHSPLVELFDEALREMEEDGTLEVLNARWFSPKFAMPGAPES
jgi:polar amino acid transport system substrate-binding protein